MRDLRRRVPTALVYGAVLLVGVLAGAPVFAALLAIVAAVAYAELVLLYRGRAVAPAGAGVILVATLAAPRLFVGRAADVDLLILALGALGGLLAWRGSGILARLGATVGAAVYTGWLLGYLADLDRAGSFYTFHRLPEAFPSWLLLALLPTWAADIASYAAGSLLGRRKLAPRLSPGKTWEGTLAGLAAAALVAFGVGAFAGMPRGAVAFVAATLGAVALGGDLFESHLKRRVGAKDSGALLPGHGGVLDRIDSLIAVAPLVAAALFAVGTLG